MTFNAFILRQQYEKIHGLGDRLEAMKEQISWEPFRSIVASVFFDNKEVGGRPHTDEILVVRVLLLQSWYNLSDEELEFQIHDRISFRNFLDFPENIPDFSTMWRIRDRLVEQSADVRVWAELQRQLDEKGYKIKKGVIQDASFIEADLGRKRYFKEKQAVKKGEKIEYTEKQKQHMDKDGTFSIKHGQVHFGYKSHVKLGVDDDLIREYKTTTASLHDSQIDLVRKGDITAYRDKGYFGTTVCRGVDDKTMKRASRNHNLNGGELMRNKAISRIRAPGERPFAVVKRVFRGGRTLVKTLPRVAIKEMFKFFAYDLYQLVTLKKRELAVAIKKC
jgi:transposase, IS5 family